MKFALLTLLTAFATAASGQAARPSAGPSAGPSSSQGPAIVSRRPLRRPAVPGPTSIDWSGCGSSMPPALAGR